MLGEALLMENRMSGTDAANGVHRLVLLHGRERAREMVDPKQRLLVDIAAEVLADDGMPLSPSRHFLVQRENGSGDLICESVEPRTRE